MVHAPIHKYTHTDSNNTQSDPEAEFSSGKTSCINNGKTTSLVTVSHVQVASGRALASLDSTQVRR